jgi:hypothetical protein
VPGPTFFDAKYTILLVHDRSTFSFVENPLEVCGSLRLSSLEIALQPHIRVVIKYLSSCLHLAGVGDHPEGGCGCEAEFAKSTAPFAHPRPDGLERMPGSYVKEMHRRLHIRILLSRTGCATGPHQDQLSTESCIVLLALHAGTGGVSQWKITLLNPSYLGKKAHTCTREAADVDRAGAGFQATPSRSPAAVPSPSPRAPPSRTPAACTPSTTPRWRRARATSTPWR